MKMIKIKVLALLCMIAMASMTNAQIQMPAASPAAYVSQQVGFTKISIDYSSPGVKGRKIFGDVVPFGSPWRAGANGTTIIEFSTAVAVGGENLRAGKYALYITPAQNGEWTVHFNREGKSMYAYMTDNKINMEALSKDLAANVKVAPKSTSESAERLNFSISANDNKKGTITMTWEKVSLSFDVDVKTEDVLKNMSNNLK